MFRMSQNPHRTKQACRFALGLLVSIALVACDGSPTSPTSSRGPVGPIGPTIDTSGGVGSTNSVATEPFFYTVSAQGRTKLRLEGINGKVSITGSSGGHSVSITGERRVGSESTTDAQAHLQQLEVQVLELGDEVFVKTVQPRDTGGRNYAVDYTVTLPRNFEIYVENINGNVTLREILASTHVDVVNGQIDGRIDLPRDAAINLATANGPIALAIPHNTSADFSANVTTGSIELSNLVLHGATRTNDSLRGRLGDGRGMITLRTVNGDIKVVGY